MLLGINKKFNIIIFCFVCVEVENFHNNKLLYLYAEIIRYPRNKEKNLFVRQIRRRADFHSVTSTRCL